MKDGQVQATKVISILIKFSRQMLEVLKDMQKVFCIVDALESVKGPKLGENSRRT